MHRVNVILNAEQEHLTEHKNTKRHRKNREKSVKIDDTLFDIGLRKGLIEKTEDGYVFVGDYEELLAFKRKASVKSSDWLDWRKKT